MLYWLYRLGTLMIRLGARESQHRSPVNIPEFLMKKINVIALTGPTGSGKDTLGELLVTGYGYTRYSYGELLRAEVIKRFGTTTDERDAKFCKHGSFKDAMLHVGQQWALAKPNHLASHMTLVLERHQDINVESPVVITDLRKPLELQYLLASKHINLYLVEITRPDNPYKPKRLDNWISSEDVKTYSAYCASGLSMPYDIPSPLAVIINGTDPRDMLTQLALCLEVCLPISS